MVPFRVGHGYDIHRFDETTIGACTIKLCGYEVPCRHPVDAHSDGDVGLHAFCDALLGAIGAGDIGEHFPDTDPKWKGADSETFVKHCLALATQKGYLLANVDISIIAEVPKIAPHKQAMSHNFARIAGVKVDQVNIKATTHEKCDAIGNKEALAAHAVVMLYAATLSA